MDNLYRVKEQIFFFHLHTENKVLRTKVVSSVLQYLYKNKMKKSQKKTISKLFQM